METKGAGCFVNPFRSLFYWFAGARSIAVIRPDLASQAPRLLDVGCGNHGPRNAKRVLPRCVYHGVDRGRWNLDEEDDRCMDRFFRLDLDDPSGLSAVPDGSYDAVICSQVIEHLQDPRRVVVQLAAKLAPGGVLYLETPSARSLRLPSCKSGAWGVKGCLNFRDDETHRDLVDLETCAADLRSLGLRVRGPKVARLWRRVVLLPLYLAAVLIVKRFVPAGLLWDTVGFASCLVAVRPRAEGSHA